MRRVMSLLVVISAAPALLGCGTKFDGVIEFQNNSTSTLWVEAEGFEHNPPCGALGPEVSASANMNPFQMPPKVVLHWDKNGEAKQRTELSIPRDAIDAKSGTLLFEFDKDGKWSVVLRPEST